ncbi:carbohydrate ABC transporter permease [Microbacterium album]|uniref:ABC transporter permease n=1 Tax=Microbacterium album TaxID=2053191 RepID=A0A917MKL1_9MICO|nr:sugar ABC transporter permease [Microbacterium album]GGH36750.1 ABC transporter permease [Microbacterium album]
MTSVTVPAGAAGSTRPAPARGDRKEPGSWRKALITASFLAPALIMLGAFVAYPIVYTIIRSFFGRDGEQFVAFENYATMFTNETTFTAIRNNVIWVIVAPAACTILGLIFAVLLERLRWKTAFRLIIFMPMAISMLAAGVIFRGMFQESPQLGVVNAVISGVQNAFGDTGGYPGAQPRDGFGVIADGRTIASEAEVAAGGTQDFPLTGIRQSNVPEEAAQAEQAPSASGTQITGTVFLDVVRGGGGTNGEIEEGKSGLPGMRVEALGPDGDVHGFATTGAGGTYTIEGLEAGQGYTVSLPATNFEESAQGVSWLSSTFINAVIILSYIWIWAGFAMVMIASGLSAMDRSLQEAARMDGATEWQVFTRITVPQLAPVLVVVLVTLIINVLKIFDLVYVIPPGASRPAANVIAVEMWTVSFGGGANQGLGSALAILLLILVLPSMIINVRRFREERAR